MVRGGRTDYRGSTSAWSKLSDHLHVMHVRDPNASDTQHIGSDDGGVQYTVLAMLYHKLYRSTELGNRSNNVCDTILSMVTLTSLV